MKKLSLWSFWPAALALSTVAAAGDLPAHEVPFRLHGHLIVVEACSIGGLEGLNCVLDTGASATVIHPDIARKLKLNGTAREVATYGRKERIIDVVLPTIRWGELEFEQIAAFVGPLALAQMDSRLRVDALIGLSLLRKTSVTIDYERSVLIFGPVAHPEQFIPFYGGLPFIPIPVYVDDRRLSLALDTGASDLILYRNRAEGRIRARRTNEKQQIVYMGGKTNLSKVVLPQIALAEDTWENVPAFLLDGQSAQPGLDGLLGVSQLGLKKLHLDFERNRISWEK